MPFQLASQHLNGEIRSLWIRSYGYCAAALGFFVLGLLLPMPSVLQSAPHDWRKIFSDFGSVMGGSWALSAGLMTVYAARSLAKAEQERRRREVAASCLAEIGSVWDYLGECDTKETLRANTEALRILTEDIGHVLPASQKEPISTYRGHLGESWLSLQMASPEMFGALPVEVAQETSGYYSRLRNVIDLLNCMHSQNFLRPQTEAVIDRQAEAYDRLVALEARRGELMQRLEQLAIDR
jgi:hypothetical protein